jgi:TRAP-type C4-dicarboxylate transport system substrate-binding protein
VRPSIVLFAAALAAAPASRADGGEGHADGRGDGRAGGIVSWNLASAYAPSNFHTENLVQFARQVEATTRGTLRITVHPGGSLFKAPEIKRAVQGGQTQLGEILLVSFENADPLFGLDGIPFLAASYEQAVRLYQASRPALERLLAEQGLILLYSVPWPPQGLFTKKPIRRLADLRGARFRAYSPATARLAELIGARAVTVQAAELAQALATGAVDSYISSASTGYDSKTYEYLDRWYDAQAWLPKNAVIASRDAFAALAPAEQQALRVAAAEAERRGWQRSRERHGWYVQALAGKGMQILAPSAELAADLQRVGQVMLGEWLERSGPRGQAVVDAYRRPRDPASE